MSCNKPFLSVNPDGNIITLPCGWCLGCRIDRRRSWTIRWEHERLYNPITFITLTYNDDNMPFVVTNRSGSSVWEPTLEPDDVQLFFKRLRRKLDYRHHLKSIKYTVVGEYGSDMDKKFYNLQYGRPYGRPHYHILMSGYDLMDSLFRSCLKAAWPYGNVELLPVLRGGIAYVYKYIDKQIHGADEIFDYYNYCTPPFHRCSRGIGEQYIIDNWSEIDSKGGYRKDKKIIPLTPYWRDKYGLCGKKRDFSIDLELKKTYPRLNYLQRKLLAGDTRERAEAQKINLFRGN